MLPCLAGAFLYKPPAHDGGRWLAWHWCGLWRVMVMMSWMGVVMVVMMSGIAHQVGLRERIWCEAQSVERTRPVVCRLLVMVMMVVRMNVMVVMMCRLGPFCASLRLRCISRMAIDFLILISRPPAVFSASSCSILRASTLFNLSDSRSHEIAAFDVSHRAHARWRCRAIHGLPGCRCCASNSTPKPREHATKLHLDAWVVSTRADVSWLSSLYCLRQRRIATFAVEVGTDVQERPVHRSIARFALPLLPMHC